MKTLWIVPLLEISLMSCANGVGIFSQVKNPVSANTLYEAELVFDASLKTFNELKRLCGNRVLPPVCRTYVTVGQTYIIKASAADKAARSFVANNPTLDATNVVQAFTGLVTNFQSTVSAL